MLAPDKGRFYDLCWKHDLGKTLREAYASGEQLSISPPNADMLGFCK